MFCAATTSIVSGTLVERIKLWPFLIFTALLTGAIYPLQAYWKWGGGFLDVVGFFDLAGSPVVHSVGGWAALAGALILGARLGKYKDVSFVPMLGSNLPLWEHLSCGSVGLALTADHSWRWDRLAISPTCDEYLSTPIWRRLSALFSRWLLPK